VVALHHACGALIRPPHHPVEYPVSWLITTARRAALRSRSSVEIPQDFTALIPPRWHHDSTGALMQVSQPQPDEVVVAHARLEKIGKDILNMPNPRKRTVLAMSMAGYSLEEIASLLNLDIGTAQRYLAQARHTLRLREIKVHGHRLGKAGDRDPHTRQLLKRTRDDRRLLEIIHELPPRQGQVLALSAEGLQPRHIARMLDIDAGAVRASLCYARQRVAEVIGWPTEDVIKRLKKLGEVAEALASA
jgi:DNA-directed RNA polymerase specialized sigma24 family protein